MEKILVDLSEFIRLSKSDETLTLLENLGVDNWEWYGDALNPGDGVEQYDEIMGEVENNIRKVHEGKVFTSEPKFCRCGD